MSNVECDVAIIGCGPAGLSAAVNAKVRGKNLVLLGSEFCTPKLHKAPHVDNYLGFHSISGEQLREKFINHVKAMGIEIQRDRVTGVVPQDDGFVIQARNNVYNAKAIILATGVSVAKLIPGEDEKLGLGVSYCATCDGGLYKNRTVAVLAYTPEGVEEANYLADICEKVYLLPLYKGHQDRQAKVHEKVELIEGEKPQAIEGDTLVTGVKLENRTLKVEGVFVIRDAVLPDKLIPGLDIENDAVKINRNLATNIPGLYAAGDNTGQPHQLAKAVGEGQVASLNAVKHIDNRVGGN